MAYVYLDFNKTANGDGTWANAYSWVQAGANTTANCVVANNILSGDEIRIVGRDYFTHALAANSVYTNSAIVSSLAVSGYGTNAIGTANGTLLWFKDVRPESGSGAWAQTLYQGSAVGNTVIYFNAYATGYCAEGGIPFLYPSFSNATHTYCNSAVQAIDLNTSTLKPIQATNDGVVWTSLNASNYYMLYGLKANTLITDNWTADGVRDTTLNSNNKTVLLFANISPSAAGYKYFNFGGAYTDCGNINFDLRNTVIGSIPGTSGNTVAQPVTMSVRLFNQGTASANQALGMSYDIGAITNPQGYYSNVPTVYIATAASAYRFATTLQTENYFRLRSHQSGGYIYYNIPQYGASIGSSYFRSTYAYNARYDVTLSEGGYTANIPSVSSNGGTVHNLIFGDMIWNCSGTSTGNYSTTSSGYNYAFGIQDISSTSIPCNTYILFDRSRHITPYATKTQSMSYFPIGMGVTYTYTNYHVRYKSLRFAANGTISLSNSHIYGGGVMHLGSTGIPGALAGGSYFTPNTSTMPSVTTATYNIDGVLDWYYKAAYYNYISILPSLSKQDFLSPLTSYTNISTAFFPQYRIYELPVMSTPFGTMPNVVAPGAWTLYKSIIVDKDQNFGNTSVEYVPTLRINNYGGQSFVPAYVPVTACTDVVSTGYSLKFNLDKVSSDAYVTGAPGGNPPVIANSYNSGYAFKTIDIPPFSNTATKTISFYIKRDANTPHLGVMSSVITVNSQYSNTSANNYSPAATQIANIAPASITTTYTQFTNTVAVSSTTGNRLMIGVMFSSGPPNGAIYIDQITIV